MNNNFHTKKANIPIEQLMIMLPSTRKQSWQKRLREHEKPIQTFENVK
jgi:uncharacterized membrane protein